ncbi:MAG: RNA-guided pseudouridylation complex pseudouridine synthase subunit Cbf5 [Methanomassiliicoccales archaeon]|jgi:H/ACA ribonucleoprotein complex subunit 4|nr:RNA-guided pseudouridylation complex pseudouridine synthase subunit Cbf5 [Methanomassiliicoccales archaeon]
MLVREESFVSKKWGKPPSTRSVQELLEAGVINLDKPAGPTSHQVTAWVRDILGIKKVAHGGTLDPNVSGVLPIATGKAIRAIDLTLKSDKEYICLMRLHRDKQEEDIRKILLGFVGEIFQTPPVRSAVKRQMRVRRIHDIKIIEIRGREVLFRVSCDAGTYIRTLCYDVGEALGTGAHMEELRRVRSGNMREEDSYKLQDVKDAIVFWKEENDDSLLKKILMPFEKLLEPLPKIIIKDSAVDAICHGADLAVVGIARLDADIVKGSTVAIMTEKGEGVALGTAEMSAERAVIAKEGIAAKTTRVFMKPGTYPKMW